MTLADGIFEIVFGWFQLILTLRSALEIWQLDLLCFDKQVAEWQDNPLSQYPDKLMLMQLDKHSSQPECTTAERQENNGRRRISVSK